MPRGAAQAGLSEGAERSARVRTETNVERVVQPKAAPYCFSAGGAAGRNELVTEQPETEGRLAAKRQIIGIAGRLPLWEYHAVI